MSDNNGDIIIYQSDDGLTHIDVKIENETVWLNQDQMSELFQRDKSTISRHIKNIFDEGELDRNSVVAKNATTAADGKTYDVEYYSLDVIISVGYRVKSLRGTQFRIWANGILKEYLVKGFSMNDNLLKSVGGGYYWKELLARIRDIRSSEKVLYRQVLDLYATSIDYDPKSDESVQFFKIVQNKLHYATHGHTAAEVIYERADAEKPFMGLTSFKGDFPVLSDTKVAKNYLSEDELRVLNNLVSGYFDLAEINAIEHRPMYMKGRLFLWLKQQNDLTEDFNVRFISAGSTAKDNIKSCTEKPKRKSKRKSEKSKTNLTEELTLSKAQRLLPIA